MRINNNIHALNAYRNLSNNQFSLGRNMEKLSSGLRINRAADDAAGLAISEKMRSQIRGLEMAERNSLNGISLIQTAEGALNEVHSMLQRMKELAVQAANETNDVADRREIQKEINQLLDEIDRISNDTEFNTKKLLDGSLSSISNSGPTPPTSYELTGGTIDFSTPIDVSGASTFGNTFEISIGSGIPVQIIVPDKIYDGTTNGINDLASDLEQAIITAGLSGISVTVNSSGDSIVFAANQSVTFGDAGGNLLAALGFNDGDILNPVNQPPTTSGSNGISLQIGANEGQQLSFEINEVSTRTLGFGIGTLAYDPNDPRQTQYSNLNSLRVDPSLLETATSGGVLTNADAGQAMTIIERAIQQTSSERSKMGAIQNRLEHAINNLSTTRENLTAAESRIRDADMAKEMTEFTKNNIKNQAATAMLAQANQLPQGVLQLLQ